MNFPALFLGMYLLDVGDIIYIYICRGIHALILERLLGKVYFKFIFTKNSSLGNFRICLLRITPNVDLLARVTEAKMGFERKVETFFS